MVNEMIATGQASAGIAQGIGQAMREDSPMGVKGIGEAGTMGSAQVNAVVDALTPTGVKHIDLPVRPKRVWAAMREARV